MYWLDITKRANELSRWDIDGVLASASVGHVNDAVEESQDVTDNTPAAAASPLRWNVSVLRR
jgi:hypothetical protein